MDDRIRPFYNEFAWAYDALVDRPVADECAFLVSEAGRRGIGPGSSVLDVGCGTGRHAIALAEKGYCVRGIDRAPAMIAEAQRAVAARSVLAVFETHDLLQFTATPPVDLVLCRGVLNDLLDDGEREQAIAALARSLRPGGLLALDVRDWSITAQRKASMSTTERGVETQWGPLVFRGTTRLDPEHQMLVIDEEHWLGSRPATPVQTVFRMRCWTQPELERLLARYNLTPEQWLGAYAQDVPVGATDRLVLIARREEGGGSTRGTYSPSNLSGHATSGISRMLRWATAAIWNSLASSNDRDTDE